MQTIRLMARQWMDAGKAKVKLGFARAAWHGLAVVLVLAGLGFGLAGGIIALAAQVGTALAFGIVCAAFLAVALAVIGRIAARETAAQARTASAPPTQSSAQSPTQFAAAIPASEVAFLLGFVAMRALLQRQSAPPAPPPRRP